MPSSFLIRAEIAERRPTAPPEGPPLSNTNFIPPARRANCAQGVRRGANRIDCPDRAPTPGNPGLRLAFRSWITRELRAHQVDDGSAGRGVASAEGRY